ncbi:hypothetical protein F4777DRAFT_152972 [Nemania sp. FL0916]|nr:hypothetical protein F4777DRAFT_152972 [Nemania sp. FL0916]
MLSKTLLTTAAVAGIATASMQIPALAARDLVLDSRQDSGSGSSGSSSSGSVSVPPKCEAALSAIQTLTDEPIPPTDLATAVYYNPCTSLTGKLSSEWAVYTADVSSWLQVHSAQFASVTSACSDLLNSGAIPTDDGAPACSTGDVTGTGIGSGSAVTPAPTSSGSSAPGSGSNSNANSASITAAPSQSSGAGSAAPSSSSFSSVISTSTTPNAAPRETSFLVAAAVAAVGFVGAVAAL